MSNLEIKVKNNLLAKAPKKVVQLIRKGDGRATWFVGGLLNDSKHEVRFRSRLVKAGLVEVLLDFVDKCSSHSFDQARGGGDVVQPSAWVAALASTVVNGHLPEEQANETRLLVARRIQPLAECMADPKEELFRSRRYFIKTLPTYTDLLHNLTFSGDTLPILRDVKPVVDFSVQALFLQKFRPDIAHDLERYESADEADIRRRRGFGDMDVIKGKTAITLVFLASDGMREGQQDGQDWITEFQRAFLKQLGAVRVVSSGYDNCDPANREITFASALLDLMLETELSFALEALIDVVTSLSHIECYGRHEVAKLIQLGRNSKSRRFADAVASAIHGSLFCDTSEHPHPDDGMIAHAIRAGLLEMCLFMGANHGIDCCDPMSLTGELLRLVGMAALSRKSCKALQSCANAIRSDADIMLYHNGDAVSEQVAMIHAVVDKAVISSRGNVDPDIGCCCDCCHATILPEAAKDIKCSGCHSVCYCSHECQAKHWEEGHKQKCPSLKQQRRQVLSEISHDDVKNTERLLLNAERAGDRLFTENLENIFLLATLKGFDVVDGVVVLNFWETPPTLELKPVSVFIEDGDIADEHLHYQLRQNQQRGYLSVLRKVSDLAASNMGGACCKFMTLVPDHVPWNEQQQQANERRASWLEEIREDPAKVEAAIQKLSKCGRVVA